MTLIKNTDYVFSPKMTFLGPAGLGKGCLVGTNNLLVSLPMVLTEIDVRTQVTESTTTRYSFGGKTPAQAVEVTAEICSDLEEFETTLQQLAEDEGDGVVVELSGMQRLKVELGWFSKGIYYSERAKGPGWKAFTLGDKVAAQAFADFYANHDLAKR